jgi:hypothetical protein
MDFQWYLPEEDTGGSGGGGGGETGNFWSLEHANAEVERSVVQILNSEESVFPKLFATYGNYTHSRSIFVDLSEYNDSTSYILDIFGDITNVPIGVRYHFYITGYNGSLKIDFPLDYKTNWTYTHIPNATLGERYTIDYSGATKIEFIKLDENTIWVDVINK